MSNLSIWKTLLGCFIVLSLSSISLAQQPELKMPFPNGYTSRCNQAAGGGVSHQATSTRYDVDLNTENNIDEVIVAAASGIAYVFPNPSNAFGNFVNIDHGPVPGATNGDRYFTIYGHLKTFLVSSGQFVSQGQPIGMEGCTGTCTGDHLHFGMHRGNPSANVGVSIVAQQIRAKLNGQVTTLTSEQFREGFNYQSDNTYPAFSATSTSWNFTADSQFWTLGSNGAARTMGFNAPGAWVLEVLGNDPQLISAPLWLQASQFRTLEIHMASLANNTEGQVFFTTDTSPNFSEDKSVKFTVIRGGAYNTHYVDLSNNPNWRGQITRIRFDPVAGGNREAVGIRWINLTSNVVVTPNPTGSVQVRATLNGEPWSGALRYHLVGPSLVVSGVQAPDTTQNAPLGQYTLSYESGGPDSLISITPSATQTLGQGSVVTFTINFGGQGGGEVEVPSSYASNASISPATPVVNQPLTITTNITNGPSAISGVIVDLEIYNTANQKVFQSFTDPQAFAANQARGFTFSWMPALAGDYRIKIGLFNSSWTVNHYWNDTVLSFSVGSGNPPSSTSHNIEVWWPTDGAQVSGTQPFKAMLTNLPVSDYTMYWQVDGGQLNLMPDNLQDYPHKEVTVDLSGWNWRGNGPYSVNLVAKDLNGNIITQRAINILVVQ